MKRTFALLVLAFTCLNCLNATEVNQYTGHFIYRANKSFSIGETINYNYGSFALVADSGFLVHDLPFQISLLNNIDMVTMPSNMLNVTGECKGYRLLPNGEHFTSPARISIPYDENLLPQGYKDSDIHTFYFDESIAQWSQLERLEVDTLNHIIISLTNHFTDFANAVIKVPDMPESKAFVPTVMVDMPDVNPMQGIPMIDVPTINNKGTAELTYPIELPRGRHGMQPNIDLHYSSAGGNGVLGVGWSIAFPAITIDTRWGVPRYDPKNESEQYLVNGAAVLLRENDGSAKTLPYQDNSFIPRQAGSVRFYARDTKNQDRIIRVGTNPTNYWWAVTDRNGITTYYGRDSSNPSSIDESSVVRTDSNCIAYWAATMSEDVYGNYILYKNRKVGNNIYVHSIDYTGNYNQKVQPLYNVKINYKSRDDVSTNGRLGVLQEEQELLCNILVRYRYPDEPNIYNLQDNLAAYYMCYNEPDETSMFKSRLEKIVMLDSIHYVMPERLETCNLEQIKEEGAEPNIALLQKLKKEAEKNHDLEWLHQLESMEQHYGEKSIPASTTSFTYANAPLSSSIFSNQQIPISINGTDKISASQSTSWSIGGTMTVGFGPDVATTILSGGGNYDYSRNKGECTSMLMDINGDGLSDIVYEDNGEVKYCRQYKQGDKYAFASGVTIPGLTRLSREVSNTHTWGLQLSFGADLSYSNPITTSYTDIYFSDINGDGLPDMIDEDRILINHLDDNSNPSFDVLDIGQQAISVHNSCSRSIIFDGEVDEHIECDLKEVLVDSTPLETNSETTENDGLGVERVNDKEMRYPEMKYTDSGMYVSGEQDNVFSEIDDLTSKTLDVPTLNAPRRANRDASLFTTEDSLISRIEGGYINTYRLEYVCSPRKNDPKIEIVRVWVAPKDGNVKIIDDIALLKDTSKSRSYSRTADGVQYSIQLCDSVNPIDNHHLKASQEMLLHQGTIDADDTTTKHWVGDTGVKKGDVIMFHLRSGENNLFDKTHWHHIIQYSGESQIYDSERDYICTGDGHFQAYKDGEVVLTFTGRNDDTTPVNLRVCKNGVPLDTLNSIIPQGTVNITPISLHVEAKDSILISLGYNGNEPQWGNVHLIPRLQYIADFPTNDSYTVTVHDTVTYYPDIQIIHSSSYLDKESPYRKLFGPLYKGWGEFAYQNINNSDIILLDSLENTQLLAANAVTQEMSSYVPDTSNLRDGNQDVVLSKVNSILSESNIYNPISKSNYWVPMRADSRTEQWIAYGNMGAIGKSLHSNAREITSYEMVNDTIEEIVEYDSSLPYKIGEGRVNNFVHKQSRSSQHSISWGALILNESVSFGTYDAVVDYMDMNGDGYPDFVGKDGIQYSMPWGGIGKLQPVKNFSSFKSKNLAGGIAFSASAVQLQKLAGNSLRDGKFHLNTAMGVSEGVGNSSTKIQFMDVNADGLPDKIDVDNSKVYYNLGYQFSDPYTFYGNVSEGSNRNSSVNANIGTFVESVSPQFSVAQMSISGGGGCSSSTDITNELLIDINGDGLPDKVSRGSDSSEVSVSYNLGNNNFSVPKALSGVTSIGDNKTTSFSTSLSATAGISLAIVKIDIGLQSSPYGTTMSQGDVMLTDINGDGLVDYVRKVGSNIHVCYNTTANANLLTAVTNPTGQCIELEYALSEPSTAHRSRQWNLTQIKSSAPAHPMQGARMSIMDVEYQNAYYDNYERTDYGYEYVRTTTNKDKVNRYVYYNHTFLQNGELAEDSIMDLDGNMYIHHQHGLKYKDILSGHEHNGEDGCDDANTRVAEEGYWTEYYEKEKKPQITTRYTIQYDNLHNIIKHTDYGDTAISNDDWRQEITYLTNTANNMISLPKTENIFGAGKLLRSSVVNYSKYGEPVHISFDDKNQGLVATTHLRYDNFGNIVAIIAPEDANKEYDWSAFDYDSVTFSNVVAIHNPYRTITRTMYDYRWGLPIRTIDPAGNEMRFTYDYKGRLSSVLSPIEIEHGKEYTVKYEYNLINHNLRTQAPYKYTHVYKDMYDSLSVQREISIYDEYGKKMQQKHFAEVNGKDEWVVDGAEEWDAYGRAIQQGYPFVAKRNPHEYEPISNASEVIYNKYDALDRPIEQTNADGTQKVMNYHFRKDMKGVVRLMTSLKDENGITTITLKSPQDWTIQQIAGDKSPTSFEYSPIGELLHVTDADGYQTTYKYDMLGRLISRTHPDAGETKMEYDLAGNLIKKQTANLSITNEDITYIYKFSRLLKIQYPHHWGNNVSYLYDQAGRVAVREDGTGSEEFVYDQLGNVAQSVRRIVIPTEDQAYIFRTLYKYDSFGRMRNIIYPDGEVVHYGYTAGGFLKSVAGIKNGNTNIYLGDRKYDEQGRKIFQLDGNGVWTRYVYEPKRQWLSQIYTELPSGDVMQDLRYSYDHAGNIKDIDQTASYARNGLGGSYKNHYQYDRQYRLIMSQGGGAFSYDFNASYSPSGRMGNKFIGTNRWTSNLLYGYDQKHINHQIRTAFDSNYGTMDFYWDANGNLAQVLGCKQNSARLHEWDEENRLRFVIGDKYAGYYGYDADGERVYKLTGISGIDQVNSGYTKAHAIFDECTLYPSPYIVVTNKSYTKHYYAGDERLATVLGSGGFGYMTFPYDQLGSQHDINIVKSWYSHYPNYDPFLHEKHLSEPIPTEDIKEKAHPELDYNCNPVILEYLEVLTNQDMLLGFIKDNERDKGGENDIYFYHGDHLGSANWITDQKGVPIQYIHYAPYGELIDNQRAIGYNERYKFTGKERDWESGYDYFGARFYWSPGGHWLSVDPLVDKYLWISPYAYCAWNPIKYVDPNGKWFETAWDVANVLMDAASLISNIKEGNVGGTIVDGVGLILDASAVVLPVIPGGVGTAIKAYRTADKTIDVVQTAKKIDRVADVNKAATSMSDAAILKKAPSPNNGVAKQHGGAEHNKSIDDYISHLPSQAENVRKNQVQADVHRNRVGNNRPDVQYDLQGKHYNVEFDYSVKNSQQHGTTIQKNDPNSEVVLKIL